MWPPKGVVLSQARPPQGGGFTSTDWFPPIQTPGLKGDPESRQEFLDQGSHCAHWFHTPKAKVVSCRVLRVEPSGKAVVRFGAAERAVSQQRLVTSASPLQQ